MSYFLYLIFIHCPQGCLMFSKQNEEKPQVAITKIAHTGGFKPQTYFTVPEAGKSKVKVLTDLVSSKGLLPSS